VDYGVNGIRSQRLNGNGRRRWNADRRFEGGEKKNADPAKPEILCAEMLPYPRERWPHGATAEPTTIGDVSPGINVCGRLSSYVPSGWAGTRSAAAGGNAAITAGNSSPPRMTEHEYLNPFKRGVPAGSVQLLPGPQGECSTCEPEYTGGTNGFFFAPCWNVHRLPEKRSRVNWCPQCMTVLRTSGGERLLLGALGLSVEAKKAIVVLRITQYSDHLLESLDNLERRVARALQTMGSGNWIGKVAGTRVRFAGIGLEKLNRGFLYDRASIDFTGRQR